jgi:hypothetical protein
VHGGKANYQIELSMHSHDSFPIKMPEQSQSRT